MHFLEIIEHYAEFLNRLGYIPVLNGIRTPLKLNEIKTLNYFFSNQIEVLSITKPICCEASQHIQNCRQCIEPSTPTRNGVLLKKRIHTVGAWQGNAAVAGVASDQAK
jgi:hypothetical protein